MARLPQPGDVFGRYVIDRRLGHGGMGVVFAATQTDLGRDVALKILSPDLAEADHYQHRFAREAKLLARVDSLHIVQIFDSGVHDGWLYLAMQLVPGGDLKQLLDRSGPLVPRDALRLLTEVAEGIEDAHRAGVLHRDIKPSNILLRLTARGRYHAYVADLGISQALAEEATRTQGLIGSWAYMAPERHQGVDATVQSDIYSLGCVLWAALTGHQPYDGTDMQMALGHMNEAIPQLTEDVEPEQRPVQEALNQVLRICMAKDPGERFVSAADMRDALERVLVLMKSAPRKPPVEVLDPVSEKTVIREPVLEKPKPVQETPPPAPSAPEATVRRPAPVPIPSSPRLSQKSEAVDGMASTLTRVAVIVVVAALGRGLLDVAQRNELHSLALWLAIVALAPVLFVGPAVGLAIRSRPAFVGTLGAFLSLPVFLLGRSFFTDVQPVPNAYDLALCLPLVAVDMLLLVRKARSRPREVVGIATAATCALYYGVVWKIRPDSIGSFMHYLAPTMTASVIGMFAVACLLFRQPREQEAGTPVG